jgi:hypothetical protein
MKDVIRTTSRLNACCGCDAIMIDPEISRLSAMNQSAEIKRSALDRLWHYEFRPMAAMLCLLEDTNP